MNPQFSLPRPLFLMPSDPRRLEDIQQQPKAPRAHWMARRSICGQKPVGHHYYVCIYIYMYPILYIISLWIQTLFEKGLDPKKSYPKYFLRRPYQFTLSDQLRRRTSFFLQTSATTGKHGQLLGHQSSKQI